MQIPRVDWFVKQGSCKRRTGQSHPLAQTRLTRYRPRRRASGAKPESAGRSRRSGSALSCGRRKHETARRVSPGGAPRPRTSRRVGRRRVGRASGAIHEQERRKSAHRGRSETGQGRHGAIRGRLFCKMIRRTPRRWSFEKECLRASAVRKGGVGRKPCGSIAAPSCPRSLRRSANASDDISSLHPQRPRTDRTGSPAPGRCAEQVPRQSRRRERKRSPDAFPRRFAPQPLIPLNRRACMEQRFSL